MVKRVLKRHGYPPDKQEIATRTVLEQAELLSADWGVEPPADTVSLPDFPLAEEHAQTGRMVADPGAPLHGAGGAKE
jgi:hypothetical protein